MEAETVPSPGAKESLTMSKKSLQLLERHRIVFMEKSQSLHSGAFAFVWDALVLRRVVLRRILPQLSLALLAGVIAQLAKLALCGEEVQGRCSESDDNCEEMNDCVVTIGPSAHYVTSVFLSLLLVFRLSRAYERFYSCKVHLQRIRTGVHDLNVAFTVSLRMPRRGEENYRSNASAATEQLQVDRLEVLRLSNLLYAFIRQSCRESRLGYSDTGPVKDSELVKRDAAARPQLPSLFRNARERDDFAALPPDSRANMVMAQIQSLAEAWRRSGYMSAETADSVFNSLAQIMTSATQVASMCTTPMIHVLAHLLDLLLFLFVFSSPFVYSPDFGWVTPFACAATCLLFYGMSELGHQMEDPVAWERGHHDLTLLGWQIYCENTSLHELIDKAEREEESEDLKEAGGGDAAPAPPEVNPFLKEALRLREAETEEVSRLMRWGGRHVVENMSPQEKQHLEDIKLPQQAKVLQSLNSPWRFLWSIFRARRTVISAVLPQMAAAMLTQLLVIVVMEFACDPDLSSVEDCVVTVDLAFHSILGLLLAVLLVFRINLAYDRFWLARAALDRMQCSLRNVNVLAGSALHAPEAPKPKSPDHKPLSADGTHHEAHNHKEREARKAYEYACDQVKKDRFEVFRLSSVMFAFVRQCLRENRLGYPVMALGKKTNDAEELTENDAAEGGKHQWEKDIAGKPKMEALLHNHELRQFSGVSPWHRANAASGVIQRILEHHRRCGHISDQAACQVAAQLEQVLDGMQACKQVIHAPLPQVYLHLLNLLTFLFVFTLPFALAWRFRWAALGAIAAVSLFLYGVNELCRLLETPFGWSSHCIDLSEMGWNMFTQLFTMQQRLFEASQESEGAAVGSSGGNPNALMMVAAYMNLHATLKTTTQALTTGFFDPEGIVARYEIPPPTTEDEKQEVLEVHGASVGMEALDFVRALFQMQDSVLPLVAPQAFLAAVVGAGVHFWLQASCGYDNVGDRLGDCNLAFDDTAHSIVGALLAFLLVFRLQRACLGFMAAHERINAVRSRLRTATRIMLVGLRTDIRGEPGFIQDKESRGLVQRRVRGDRRQLTRLTSVFAGFTRQGLRDQRLGLQHWRHIEDSELVLSDPGAGTSSASAGAGLPQLLTAAEAAFYSTADVGARPALVTAQILKTLEGWRSAGCLSPALASAVFQSLTQALQEYKGAEALLTWPPTPQTMHLQSILLFLFCFSAPLALAPQFGVLTFAASALLAASFYAVHETALAMQDPFKWCSPRLDLSSMMTQLHRENKQTEELLEQMMRREERQDEIYNERQTAHGHGHGHGPHGTHAHSLGDHSHGDHSHSAHAAAAGLDKDRRLSKSGHDSAPPVGSHVHHSVHESLPNPQLGALHPATPPQLLDSIPAALKLAVTTPSEATVPLLPGGRSKKRLQDPTDHTARKSKHGEDLQDEMEEDDDDQDEGDGNDRSEREALNGAGRRQRVAGRGNREALPRRGMFHFLTSMFISTRMAHRAVLPPTLVAGLLGLVAAALRSGVCPSSSSSASDCMLLLSPEAHTTAGLLLAMWTAYRAQAAWRGKQEGARVLGSAQSALTTLHLAVGTFMRAQPHLHDFHAQASRVAADRVELHRLSAMLLAFMRQAIREQRVGYPGAKYTSDLQLLQEDKMGQPALGAILSAQEVAQYSRISFIQRPAVVAHLILRILDHYRSIGHLSPQGALLCFEQTSRILQALKDCERLVESSVPSQYSHMLNALTAAYVFSAPFVFALNFAWTAPLPSMLLAWALYSALQMAETMERQFDWELPHHDLSGMAWVAYREGAAILRCCLTAAEESLPSVVRLVEQMPRTRDQLAAPSAKRANGSSAFAAGLSGVEGSQAAESQRAALLAQARVQRVSGGGSGGRTFFHFLTQLKGAAKEGTSVLPTILPQVVGACLVGYIAQVLKLLFCRTEVTSPDQCPVTFSSNMHILCAVALGFWLVHRAQQAQEMQAEGRAAMDRMFASLRSASLALATFSRPLVALPGGSHESVDFRDLKHPNRVVMEMKEVGRLVDVVFALARQAVREQRHGYPTGKGSLVSDQEVVCVDHFGVPSLSVILSAKEREMYLSLEPECRVHRAVVVLLRLVERRQRLGLITALQAKMIRDLFREVIGCYVRVLAVSSLGSWEFRGTQLTATLLLLFVFSSAFVLSLSFHWLTPLGAALIALAFYGAAEIGNAMKDPFRWTPSQAIDLTSLGTRLHNEIHLISELVFPSSNQKALVLVSSAGAYVNSSPER